MNLHVDRKSRIVTSQFIIRFAFENKGSIDTGIDTSPDTPHKSNDS